MQLLSATALFCFFAVEGSATPASSLGLHNQNCAVGSVHVLLQQLGDPRDLSDVLLAYPQKSRDPDATVSMLEVRNALRSFGYGAHCVSLKNLPLDRLPAPLIALVGPPMFDDGHYFVLVCVAHDGFQVIDATKQHNSRVDIDKETLLKKWHGHAVIITESVNSPSASFRQPTAILICAAIAAFAIGAAFSRG